MVNVSSSIGSTRVHTSPKTRIWGSFSGDFNGSTWSPSVSVSAQMEQSGAWWNSTWTGSASCNGGSAGYTFSGGSRHSGTNVYGASCSFSCNAGEGQSYETRITHNGGAATGSVTMPYLWKDPNLGASVSVSDNTPATGSAAGSGTTVNYSWWGSWNSCTDGRRLVYCENFKGDGNQYVVHSGGSGDSGSGSARVVNIASGYNNFRVWARWYNASGTELYTQLARVDYTLHDYVNPSYAWTQSPPSTMIAGTSSISVPFNITTYNNGDYVDQGEYFYHFTRNRVRGGVSNTDNIQLIDMQKKTHSGTTTFNQNLSNLIPNDSFYVNLEKLWKDANNNNQYASVSNTVSVIHREPSELTGLSYQATNMTTNKVVSKMVEGYTYSIKFNWTAPSDWGTRSGTRMIHLDYVLDTTSSYNVTGANSGAQNHNVAQFAVPITGTSSTTKYKINSYPYVDSTSNKGKTTVTNLAVDARVKPTASNISLSSARVTTATSPSLLMADTPNWGNTQQDSTRLTTYDLYIDDVLDSSHYVKPGESKQITAKGQYTWGDHKAYVKATYTSDLGSNTYTTNTVDIEIGDYPFAPTVAVSPLSIRAGQKRTFTWSLTPNAWNLTLGRCYTYTIEVDGVVKESGTKTADTTSISYSQIYAKSGTVTLKIYQTNQLGNSQLVTVSGILNDPIPPTKSTIDYSVVPLALPEQVPVVNIVREDNGTYEQNNATIKIDFYHGTTFVKNIVAQTNISMTATSYTMAKVDLSAYMDGTYSYKVTYIKYFTTGDTITTVYDQQVVPPEVKIIDNTTITVPDQILHINFDIKNTFDKTNPYWIEYSMDYGKTWIHKDNIMKLDVQCQFLDEIYIRAFGKNPVDQLQTENILYEIPSQYHLKGSSNGEAMKTLRRVRASSSGGPVRKVKRIKK